MAVGMPVPMQLWSKKDWNYTVDYNGKLYRNIAGFFRNHATGAPSFDHWYAPWYAPGHSKHEKYWQEVVGYTNRLGSFVSGKTAWDGKDLSPDSHHLYIDDENQLEVHVDPTTDKEWTPELQRVADVWGSKKESVVMVTFSRNESSNWWKGLKVTYPALAATTGAPLGISTTTDLEVTEDGASDSFFIPLGKLSDYVVAGFSTNAILSRFEFQAAKTFGIHYPVGGSLYKLMDVAGKHVRINWVHDGGRDSDFYGVPKTYDLDGDEVNLVKSTQTPRADGSTAINFKISPGIMAWKGIGVELAKGKKAWLGTANNVLDAPGMFLSNDPVAEWREYIHVEFWKAAFLGVQTYQKRIRVKTSTLVGHTNTFTWLSDGTNYSPLKSGYTADGGHDKISVQTAPLPPRDEDKALILFEVGPGISWWKALQIRLTGGNKGFLGTQDPVTSGVPFWLTQKDLPHQDQAVAIEFWKWKFLGLHTYVGEAKITWDSMKGKTVIFVWEND